MTPISWAVSDLFARMRNVQACNADGADRRGAGVPTPDRSAHDAGGGRIYGRVPSGGVGAVGK